MARQARIEYAGAVHHVRSRGNSGQAVFLDDQDRIHFLELLAEAVRHYGWLIVRIRMVASDSKGKPLTDAKAEFLRTPQHVEVIFRNDVRKTRPLERVYLPDNTNSGNFRFEVRFTWTDGGARREKKYAVAVRVPKGAR